jgi:hypothetical protein
MAPQTRSLASYLRIYKRKSTHTSACTATMVKRTVLSPLPHEPGTRRPEMLVLGTPRHAQEGLRTKAAPWEAPVAAKSLAEPVGKAAEALQGCPEPQVRRQRPSRATRAAASAATTQARAAAAPAVFATCCVRAAARAAAHAVRARGLPPDSASPRSLANQPCHHPSSGAHKRLAAG